MERIDYHEGETFHLGGFAVTVAHARAGRLVAFIGTGECETATDTKRLARLLRAKIDKPHEKEQDSD